MGCWWTTSWVLVDHLMGAGKLVWSGMARLAGLAWSGMARLAGLAWLVWSGLVGAGMRIQGAWVPACLLHGVCGGYTGMAHPDPTVPHRGYPHVQTPGPVSPGLIAFCGE